jgi:hypothetical protein
VIPEVSRRAFLGVAGSSLVVASAKANISDTPHVAGVNQALVRRALAAMRREAANLTATDRLAVVDFALPSRTPRMHLIDLNARTIRSVLVAHGIGSDPDYTGWLQQFSNIPGSYASSDGSYVTGPAYIGQHGHSLRLNGLSRTNSNAEERAIVIHSAWYVNEAQAASAGKIGRSNGCFAIAKPSLEHVMTHLGTGRFLYAEKMTPGF